MSVVSWIPTWPETPCVVCGKLTADEGGYCSEACLAKEAPDDTDELKSDAD